MTEEIRNLWSQYTGRTDFHLEDNFFDIGGNSFLFVRLAAELKEKHQVELDTTHLFQYPTIALLARHIEDLRTKATEKRKEPRKGFRPSEEAAGGIRRTDGAREQRKLRTGRTKEKR